MKTLSIIISIVLAFSAQAQTSKDTPKLKDALERFPKADANGDGVLTMEEAKAFKEKAAASDKKGGGGDGIRSSYNYKTVGKDKLELFVDPPRGHKKDAKAPAIVFFHGGGFKTGSVNQFRTQSKYLADRGMVGIRVRYRLTRDKGVEVTDCVEDAISAMRWVRANAGKLGVDPDRIAASGGSAGGYLSIATEMIDFINAKTDPAGVSAKPNAMVLFNPGIGGAREDGSRDPRDPEGKYDLNKYVKPGQPPAIIFHGKEDKVVPYASAEAFTAAMKKAGNSCALVGYEGAGHSFFNQDKYFELTIAEADKFLTGLGWLKKKTEDTVKDAGLKERVEVLQLQGGFAGFTGDYYAIETDGSWSTGPVLPPKEKKGEPKAKGKLTEAQLSALAKELARHDLANLPSHGAPVVNPKVIKVRFGENVSELQPKPGQSSAEQDQAIRARYEGIVQAVKVLCTESKQQ